MARFAQGGPAPGDWAVLALVRVLGAIVGTLFVLVAVLYTGYLSYTDLESTPVEVPTVTPAVDATGRRATYGRSWLARDGGLWHLHLEGTPAEIGDAHGHLTDRLFHDLEGQVQRLLKRRYPAFSEAWAANILLRWNYRGADTHLAADDRRELTALAGALPEAQTGRYSAYHVMFLHQCFQVLAQRLEDVVVEGSVFAAGPRRSNGRPSDGNLVVGRTFSVDLGHDYEPDRVVAFHYPDGKYPFVSVGWAGFMGVVTGVNARGVFVALNATRTDDPLEEGAPLPLVLRQVLEEADTLEHAVAILREADLRTSGIVLIGDGMARRAVVMELAARDKDERRVTRGEDESVVWATNHMTSDAFLEDPFNDKIRRDTSSGRRYDRLGERLGNNFGLTPGEAADILRDRRGPHGTDLGLGNKNALESLSTTHGVVVDLTAMVLWVSEGPSAMGRFQAFDLRHRLGRQGQRPAPLEDLPADPLLFSAEYYDFKEAQRALAYARDRLREGDLDRAHWSATIGLALAPDLGDLHRILGDVQRERGDTAAAQAHYQRYLDLIPGRLRDQERIRGVLAELGG